MYVHRMALKRHQIGSNLVKRNNSTNEPKQTSSNSRSSASLLCKITQGHQFTLDNDIITNSYLNEFTPQEKEKKSIQRAYIWFAFTSRRLLRHKILFLKYIDHEFSMNLYPTLKKSHQEDDSVIRQASLHKLVHLGGLLVHS